MLGDVLIDGTLTVQDGTQGIGKVFTSDSIGQGSWQEMPNAASPRFYTIVETTDPILPGSEGNVFLVSCDSEDVAVDSIFFPLNDLAIDIVTDLISARLYDQQHTVGFIVTHTGDFTTGDVEEAQLYVKCLDNSPFRT